MFALLDEFFSLTASELVKLIPKSLHPMDDETYRIASELEALSRSVNELSSKVHGMTTYLYPLKLRDDWQDKFVIRMTNIRSIIRKRIDDTYRQGFEKIANAINAVEESLQSIRDELKASDGLLSEESFETICDHNQIINVKWYELCHHNVISFFGHPMTGYNVIETILSDEDWIRYRIQQLNEPITDLYKELFGDGITIIGFGEGKSFMPFVSSKFCRYALDNDSLLILFNNWYREKFGENHPAYDCLIDLHTFHRDITVKNILIDEKDDYHQFVNSVMTYLNVSHMTPFMRSIVYQIPCGKGVWNIVRSGVLQLRRIDSDTYSFHTEFGSDERSYF